MDRWTLKTSRGGSQLLQSCLECSLSCRQEAPDLLWPSVLPTSSRPEQRVTTGILAGRKQLLILRRARSIPVTDGLCCVETANIVSGEPVFTSSSHYESLVPMIRLE